MRETALVARGLRAWGPMRRLGVIACVVGVACGPRVGGPSAADTSETGGGADSSSGDSVGEVSTSAGEDSSTGLPQEDCPCEWIEPPRTYCEPVLSEVVAAEREPIVLTPMPSDASHPLVLVDGGLVVEEWPSEGPHALLRWEPGGDGFTSVHTIDEALDIEGMSAAGDALLLLMTGNGEDDDLLARWTVADGYEPVTPFGTLDASLVTDGWYWQRIRVVNNHALFGVAAEDHFEVAAPDTFAVVDVDLVDGSWQLLPEPLSGYAPTEDGWVGRRPQLAMFQYCYDYSCFREDVATAWDLVTSSGTALATGGCVEEDPLGTLAAYAWLLGTDYVYTSGTAVRRISGGTDVDLWRGEGTVVGALPHDDAMIVSVSNEEEKQVLRVPLDGSRVELLLRDTPKDSRHQYHLGGILDDRLYLELPSNDLAALDL